MGKRIEKLRHRFYTGPRYIKLPFIELTSYSQGKYQFVTVTLLAWFYAFVMVHIPLASRIVTLTMVLVSMYGMLSLQMPIYLHVCLLFSFYILNMLVGFIYRPKLKFSCIMPSRLQAKSELTITYKMENKRRLACWDLRPDFLDLPGGLKWSETPEPVEYIEGHGTGISRAVLKAHKRGIYQLPPLNAASPFPFHLWQWSSFCKEGRKLIVHPWFTPLKYIDINSNMKYQPGDLSLTSKVGKSMEFLGCREFRDGDNLRKIHWQSWARTGYPVVKEFKEEFSSKTAMFLDTRRPPLKLDIYQWPNKPVDHFFETAVSFCAAICDWLAANNYQLELLATAEVIEHLPYADRAGCLEQALDTLAGVQALPVAEPLNIQPGFFEELNEICTAIIIFTTWTDDNKEFIDELTEQGIELKIILLTDEKSSLEDVPEKVIILSVNDIQNGTLQSF